MDEMDVDQIVTIPDTPDKVAARRHINGMQFRKESNPLIAGHSRDSDVLHEERLNGMTAGSGLAIKNGRCKRPIACSKTRPIFIDDFEPHNKSIGCSDNPFPSHSGHLFRRVAMPNNLNPESRHTIGAYDLEKAKVLHSRIPCKQPAHRENNVLDLTEQDEHEQVSGSGFQHVGLNDLRGEEITKSQILSNGAHSSSRIGDFSKGKEKMGAVTSDGTGSAVNQVKNIDSLSGSQLSVEKQLSASHLPVTSRRVSGPKRLVRNGCISPHNIASRAQKLAESHQADSTASGKNHAWNMVTDASPHIDILEMVSEESNYNRAKGKGVMSNPSMSKEPISRNVHVYTSSSLNELANQTRDDPEDEISNGWRRTHNNVKKPACLLHNGVDGNPVDRNDFTKLIIGEQHQNRVPQRDNRRKNITKDACDHDDHKAAQTASRPASRLHQVNEPCFDAKPLYRRPKKRGLTSRNGESSRMIPDVSEISFLGSSSESSSKPSRIQNSHHEGTLNTFEIDELSPERRNGNSQGFGSAYNDDSEARARQLEADEMLARELQEQLYNESPMFGEGLIDGNIAWALQEEDLLPAAPSPDRPVSRARSAATAHSNRQVRPQWFQNPSNRRGAPARAPNSRTSQLRNRLLGQSPTGLSRNRNRFRAPQTRGRRFQFPLEMDLDMRLDILEALEAAVGDLDDMMMTPTHMLQVQRDFNENDYEMLLALDDNNHQRGASANQINGLPESVVQNENFEEDCAICLETPTVGESIRHLPCLHKFHKDCIDQWLRRKTSCPVCKSSIT